MRDELGESSDEPTGTVVLSVPGGPLGPRRVRVNEPLTVGRGEDAGFVVEDPEMSRLHAVFRQGDEGIEVEDLGSLNGTWVNGSRIGKATLLAPGDVVDLGLTRIGVLSARTPEPLRSHEGGLRADASTPEAIQDELRPVTALFADVVGSTAVGEDLPPDEVKALIGGCVDRMARAVEQFGGVIDAYMGDGIAAFFGFPIAHEDDAERAARAALRIIEVIGEYANEVQATWDLPDFSVRVGVNSGQVGVGMVGAGARRQVALGDAMNVAARLQAAAAPGGIVIGDRTARDLGDRFLTASLGKIEVKGRRAPVEAWRLLSTRAPRARDEARTLVGRTHETEQLKAAADALFAGRGQIILLLGEPGIGKTRVVEWFRGRCGNTTTWLEGQCVSYGGELSYSPFAEILRESLGAREAEAAPETLSKLRSELEQLRVPKVSEVLPYLASLLSLKLDADSEEIVRVLPPDQLAMHIRRAYCTWVRALAGRGPVSLVLEDFHWADRLTRKLAEGLLEIVDEAPLLLATTFRIEPETEGWRLRTRALMDHPHRAVELRLGPLTEAESGQLLSLLAPGKLDDDAKREVIARAEGNPLFLEQLLRSLLETGGLAPRRTWALTVSADKLPSALESLLLARIDALSTSARRLAQVAAIVGRSFSPTVLAAVGELDQLEKNIALLLRADIIRELRPLPAREYVFTHGLLREAALSTLTRARRGELYRLIATAFETVFADSLDEHLEQLAFYHGRAGDLQVALEYLERATSHAAALQANTQAAELAKRAIAVSEKLGDVDAKQRIELQMARLAAG
jgi:class 3 adenylate cyclase